MKQSKLDYISIKQILIVTALIIVLIFVPFIFSSCISEMIGQVAEAGCKLNKVIYTTNLEKYTEGRTIADAIFDQNGNVIPTGITIENCYFLETNQLGVYDLVIANVNKSGSETNLLSATNATHVPYHYNYPITYSVFDNNYIFSGIYQRIMPDGEFVCTDSNCFCGRYTADPGDILKCGCQDNIKNPNFGNPSTITVKTELTEEEIFNNLKMQCESCDGYDILYNDDGTITYSYINICSHVVTFNHEGTFTVTKEKFFGNSNPKELIIDGYDFSIFYNFMSNTDSLKLYNQYYTGNWYTRYKPESFAYMFSDLTVEKITIKNVTGLGENAKDLSSMFENCTNLKYVDFGNLFENCQPTDISRMFYNCPNLVDVDLSTLDTSCVTNMSEMFALNGSSISAETRRLEVEKYINQYVQNDPEFADFNDGTIYTIESFIAKAYELYELTISEEYIYITLVEMGNPITLTYDEFCLLMAETNLVGVYNMALEDPTQIGLTAKEDGSAYSIWEIIGYVENTASSYGINVVHEMEMQEVKTRDGMINFFINHTLVPIMEELEDRKTYNIELVAKTLNVAKEEVVCEIVLGLAEVGSTLIPISYNEACCFLTDGQYTFTEGVNEILANQDKIALPPKENGSKYTRSEVEKLLIGEIDKAFNGYGLTVLTNKEMDNYFTHHVVTAGKLILGGKNSKFVIKNGTNTTNMFGDSSVFDTIITPNEIGDQVEIVLTNKYSEYDIPDGEFAEDGTLFLTTLTSDDANKTYYSYKEPKLETFEKEDDTSTLNEEFTRRKYIVMFIFSTLMFSIVVMAIRIVIKLNRRRKIKRYS